jgi:hypothetical protein
MTNYLISSEATKDTLSWIINNLMKDYTLNKDYIIAGGFVRDTHLGLSCKDLDIFINSETVTDILKFETSVYEKNPFDFRTLGLEQLENYTRPNGHFLTGTNNDVFIVHGDGFQTPRRNSARIIKVNETVKEIPSSSIQDGRTIDTVQQANFEEIFYPVEFIWCTIKKGFTPRNLVETFDYNIIKGWVVSPEEICFTEEAVKGFKNKEIVYYENNEKTSSRLQRTLSKLIPSKSSPRWKVTYREPSKSVMEKFTSPYREFVKNNGKFW